MLKNTSLSLAIALLAPICLAPTNAAQQYATYEQAKAHVSNTGYIVFIYPAGWDKHGEKLCKKLIANEEMKTAAKDAVLLLAPIYQKRDETTNAKAKKIMGSLAYPGDMADISYPAIIFYEKEGRQYATIHGRELMKAKPEQIAMLVKERLSAKSTQDQLLCKAQAATTPNEKARLLLEASRIAGISWPGGLREAMKSADPQDAHGYLGVLNFDFGSKEGESLDDFLKRLDAVLENKLYTPWQKQRACATAIGHIRRKLGTMAGGGLITKYARTMHKLDPDSTLGVSAPVVARDWVRQYRYGQGWSAEIIPETPIPMRMHDVPMTKPGTYNIVFKLTTGRDGIRINQLRLMDAERCVAADDSPRDVTWSNTQQVYTFTVKHPLKNPALEITYGNPPDKRSTWGEISITAQ